MKPEYCSNFQGRCPKCGKDDLDYDALEYEGEEVCYPYTCRACKFRGQEWYRLEFTTHHSLEDDKDVTLGHGELVDKA